jgi:hypothetical protein
VSHDLDEKIQEAVEQEIKERLDRERDRIKRELRRELGHKSEVTELSKLIDEKIETKIQEQNTKPNDDSGITRRNFLKKIGAGAGSLGILSLLPSTAAKLNIRDNTDFFGNIDTNGNTITDSTGQPVNINADTVDGKHANQIGGAFNTMDVFRSDGTFDASGVDTAFAQVVGGGGGSTDRPDGDGTNGTPSSFGSYMSAGGGGDANSYVDGGGGPGRGDHSWRRGNPCTRLL